MIDFGLFSQRDTRVNRALAPARGDSVNLDLMRAVAVLCVFYAHYRDRSTGTGAHISWLFGQMGVLMFFVHTSLVLMLSLERSSRRLSGAALALDFYVRRLFRIYPLSLICVTAGFLGVVSLRAEPWGWFDYASNLALTINLTYTPQMWPGLWTLPLEVQMYVVLPLLFVLLRGQPLAWAFVAWAVSVGAGLLYPYVSTRLTIAEYAPCFVAGVIAWRLRDRVVPRWSAGWWPIAMVGAWTIWFLAPRYNAEPYRWGFCLALGLLIPWFRDLTLKPLAVAAHLVAKYSYGIYLSHVAVIILAMQFEGPYRWLLLIGLGVAVPMAMYHVIEQPMIDVGRRLATRLTTRPAPEPPAEPALAS
jgi:peptidoglycan/LPS O-acetylase OafA/YrhL